MTETSALSTLQAEAVAEVNTESSNIPSEEHAERLLDTLKYVFIVGGEKGGVGKTWFTYILIELLLQLDRDPTILDLDKTTPNVAKAYLKDIHKQWSSANIQVERVFEPIERVNKDKADGKNTKA